MDSFVSDEIQSNCDTSSSSSVEPKRKRRRTEAQNDVVSINETMSATTNTMSFKRQSQNVYSNVKRWRTEREQQIYSSKLIQALHHVRPGDGGAGRSGRGRAVRRTAYRVLATSAKGATRWSRAILESSLSLRLKRRHKKVKVSAVAGLKKKNTSTAATTTKKKKKLPAVEKRLRVLGRLIPGCRKASSLNLLEETTDYIAALEMQVRVMAAIAEVMAATPPSAEDRLGANVNS